MSRELWAGALSNSCVTVLVVNRGNTTVAVNVSFANDLNVSATARMDVRDIWQQKTVGTAIVAKLQVSVAETHGCTWLKLCPATDS